MTHSGEPTSEHIISAKHVRAPLQRFKNAEGWPITITHHARPKSLPRNRYNPKGGNYLPRDAATYKKELISTIKNAMEHEQYQQLEGAVSIECFFYYSIPKKPKDDLRRYHTNDRKPMNADIDNLMKMVMDAVQDSGLIKDDRQVWRLHGEKAYTPGEPRTRMVVTPHRTV